VIEGELHEHLPEEPIGIVCGFGVEIDEGIVLLRSGLGHRYIRLKNLMK
jgi:hypothetical protein